jgi:hypothetical protein
MHTETHENTFLYNRMNDANRCRTCGYLVKTPALASGPDAKTRPTLEIVAGLVDTKSAGSYGFVMIRDQYSSADTRFSVLFAMNNAGGGSLAQSVDVGMSLRELSHKRPAQLNGALLSARRPCVPRLRSRAALGISRAGAYIFGMRLHPAAAPG